MDLKTFTTNFALLADTPNGIPKLREMILQLAVMGKLVPQNPKDEPASLLLEKIAAEKEKLIAEGKIKKPKPLSPIESDEVPYELPKNWGWVRLGEITNYGTADKIEPSGVVNGTWILELEDIEKITSKILVRMRYPNKEFKSTKSTFHAGDVLYGKLRPYLDKVIVADEPGVCTTEIIPFRGYGGINSFFLRLALKSPDFISYANSSTHGMNLPRLGTDKARFALQPLPPLAEQKRIVSKVDELLALCDELEERQKKRDVVRVSVNAACLHEMTSPEPKISKKGWIRTRNHFDLLYDTPGNVAALRQAILQLAVMGKLVPQNPKDEPASVLLEKIAAEKEKLIEEGKIKKPKPLPPIGPDEVPYEVPEGWEWVPMQDISTKVHYGYTASADPSRSDVKLLRITDIQNDKVDWDSVPGCEINGNLVQEYALSDGDIVVARTGGTIGKSYLVSGIKIDAVFASYLIRIIPSAHINSEYLKLFLGSELYWNQLYEKSMGTGQPNVNGTSLKNLRGPLPPLSEQKRIVAKVGGLMALCDKLESKLKESNTAAEKLMESVVKHATSF